MTGSVPCLFSPAVAKALNTLIQTAPHSSHLQVRFKVLPVDQLGAQADTISWCTHNVQYLPGYELDVAGSDVGACDISALQETHLGAAQDASFGLLPHHHCLRNDSELHADGDPGRPIRGSMLHTHHRLGEPLQTDKLSNSHVELTAAFVATPHMPNHTTCPST